LANKFFFRKGGCEAVLFQERDFLIGAGFDVIDFSMHDTRNLPSPYSKYFVGEQAYDTPLALGAQAHSALKLIHSPEAVRKFGRLIDRTRPDIVHCHNVYHQLTPSIIGAAKRRGVPVVLTLHDYKPICPTYTRLQHGKVCSDCIDGQFRNVVKHRCADGSLAKSLLLFAEARVQSLLRSYEQVDLFVAPSQFMRESVTRHRLPKDRVQVIYNGIDCRSVQPSLEDQGYALFLGRLSPEKGIETLLAAHARLAEKMPLVIAGTGPLEQKLRSTYPHASYLGHVSGTTLQSTIRGASLIVVPSEWYENCPMSVLEAMAEAKPVVASNIGGIPELVINENTGLLFEPGDPDGLSACLARLTANPHLRRRYGMAGRMRAEAQFSMDRHNASLLEKYATITEQTGTST
jgi:glycosyltransferase involved in cell wall biosynthesis